MFHARCCAHILNLCVQDGLEPTKEIVDRIQDGVKYVAASERRRIKFSEICMSLGLKCKKLILDVSTRWNSTFNMLSCAIKFKDAFLIYSTSDMGFKEYVPSQEDWERVEGVCSFLEVFSDVTKVVSGSEYSTSNLFLSEIRRVKQIIDKRAIDHNLHNREMARKMELKFEKYWGETNLVISICAVMDPRFKLILPMFCFPTLYPIASDLEKNLTYFRESGGIIEPTKSELEEYLSESIIPPSSKFDVLACLFLFLTPDLATFLFTSQPCKGCLQGDNEARPWRDVLSPPSWSTCSKITNI